MILASLSATELYRAHTPRWSFAPLSGAGAAVQGGRFNRKGIEALYLTLEAKTALAEYQQVSPLLEPCMLTSHIASVGRVVDLRQFDGSDVWDPLWTDWDTDWRNFAFNLRIRYHG
ncbi:RES domain-containing protein [Nitrosospira multiformis]|jgi:RES domain-containing protein|uniref:RES domain-containing protein n=1 Tax=Nitrosospira multiformis TaxID=1231 RepID=A0A2T5HZQ7_9PROT|nr:RES domain-containing protein [Nitrosospira multiformis]PTQ77075.1 RES domain-containing protein [Nitrosospira multiformis]